MRCLSSETGSSPLFRALQNPQSPFSATHPLRESEGGTQLLWGPRSTYWAAKYLSVLILEDRLRVKDAALRRAITRIASSRHESFNDKVADWFEQTGYIVRRRIEKFAGAKLSSSRGDLGDIDVLVADVSRRAILLVECKDVHVALAPFDIASQIASLSQKLHRHERRAEWAVSHCAEILEELGLAPEGVDYFCARGYRRCAAEPAVQELAGSCAFVFGDSDRARHGLERRSGFPSSRPVLILRLARLLVGSKACRDTTPWTP